MIYILLLLTATNFFYGASSSLTDDSHITRQQPCISLKSFFVERSIGRFGSAQTSWSAGSIPGLYADGEAAMVSRKSTVPDAPFTSAIETTIINLIPITLAKNSSIPLEDALSEIVGQTNNEILIRFLATGPILYNYIIVARYGDQKAFFDVRFDSSTSMPIPLLAEKYLKKWEPGTYFTDRIKEFAVKIHS